MGNLHFGSPTYHPMDEEEALLGGAGNSTTNEQITAATGYTKAQQYGIGATGSGSTVYGTITGTLKSNEYKKIYKVYNVPSSKSSGWWVFKYQSDTNRGELKQTFNDSKEIDQDYTLNFSITGNDYGINQIYVYYGTIQLKYKKLTKQYVVTNPASASAADPSGNPYGGFTPVSDTPPS
jgi:hypothetical protein